MLIALAAVIAGCTYPYEAELDTDGGGIVIEGEILIGDVSEFTMSRLFPLEATYEDIVASAPVNAVFSVEDSDGKVYPGTSVSPSTQNVDLTLADPSLKYRLHAINEDTGKRYVSEWLDVEGAAVIDGMSYTPNEDFGKMDFRISFHAPGHNSNFMVKLHEDWEYKSLYQAELYYDPDYDEVKKFSVDQNIYYCWKSNFLGKFVMLSTEELSDDVIVDHYLSSVSLYDKRLSYIYALEATVIPLSKDAYSYWNYLKLLSDYSGSLFAPNPSDMRGNLRAVDDPDENVTGYVSATEVSKRRLFYFNDVEDMYIAPRRNPSDTLAQVSPDMFYYYYYQLRYLPVNGDPLQGGWFWANRDCVDCRLEGGTKNKPAWWPNNDR